jgi:hypothetical protein
MNDQKQLTIEDLDIDIEELQAFIRRERELNALRKKHSYVGDLIQTLMGRPNGLSRQMVLHDLYRRRRNDGLPIPKSFEEAVQSSYNQHSIDSVVFKKRNLPESEAIFYAPGG